MVFEDVVGHEDDGDRARQLADLFLPADPLLQRRERHGAFVTKGEDLAVEYRAVRELAGRGDDLGKAVGDELFAARPQVQGAGALDQLRADAVPLPLDLPVVNLPERIDGVFEGRRQEERIRPREVVVGAFGGQ